jgi:hypothetical protein
MLQTDYLKMELETLQLILEAPDLEPEEIERLQLRIQQITEELNGSAK